MGLSSFLGIVVADTLWLASLQILGARRMIAIDALKPFAAAAFGGDWETLRFLVKDRCRWDSRTCREAARGVSVGIPRGE